MKDYNKGNKMGTTIQKNKKAYHEYFILEELEVGIKLEGAEVKSIREGKVNLKGSYCKFFKSELFLFECHISKYEHNNIKFNRLEETRERKLLIKKRQIDKWEKELKLNNGYSIVPLSIYFNDRNLCKLKIALVQGKKLHDKRECQKEKDVKRKLQQKDFD
jgi:SsrA-binding protein